MKTRQINYAEKCAIFHAITNFFQFVQIDRLAHLLLLN